ncbi:hypothetical protein L596_023102 [Steinernema carpocapsae]|uniref:Uncharacterized protein n=1 Tax=Steinernema carpocapsae TaxID=34508 RepID=A0A4U5MCM8_STECR|nr:hypothetical protein L596_023102 [Steinernema carpocapsae]
MCAFFAFIYVIIFVVIRTFFDAVTQPTRNPTSLCKFNAKSLSFSNRSSFFCFCATDRKQDKLRQRSAVHSLQPQASSRFASNA